MRRLAVALLALSVVVGCGEPNKLDAGQVVDTSFDDEDHVQQVSCAAYDEDMTCKLWVPYTTVEPAVYKLKIVGVHGGDTIEEWHRVSHLEFLRCGIGDHYELGKGCESG